MRTKILIDDTLARFSTSAPTRVTRSPADEPIAALPVREQDGAFRTRDNR